MSKAKISMSVWWGLPLWLLTMPVWIAVGALFMGAEFYLHTFNLDHNCIPSREAND